MHAILFLIPVFLHFLATRVIAQVEDVEWTCDMIKTTTSYEVEFGSGHCFYEIPRNEAYDKIYWKDGNNWKSNLSAARTLCNAKGAQVLHMNPPYHPACKVLDALAIRISPSFFPIDCATYKDINMTKPAVNCPVQPADDEKYDLFAEVNRADNRTCYDRWDYYRMHRGGGYSVTKYAHLGGLICHISTDRNGPKATTVQTPQVDTSSGTIDHNTPYSGTSLLISTIYMIPYGLVVAFYEKFL